MSNAVECLHFEPTSPEAPACCWCRKYKVNVDVARRLCVRCRTDAGFRHDLETFAAARAARDCPGPKASGSRPPVSGTDPDDVQPEAAWCERFGLMAAPEVCGRCKADPGYRAFLAGQRAARPKPRDPDACPHRGDLLRTEERYCCGGRVIEAKVYTCARHGEAGPEVCGRCYPDDEP